MMKQWQFKLELSLVGGQQKLYKSYPLKGQIPPNDPAKSPIKDFAGLLFSLSSLPVFVRRELGVPGSPLIWKKKEQITLREI